jgi:hypothetical protein
MRAAKSADVSAMRMLLQGGADPGLKNKTGNTALMFAAGSARGKPDQDVIEALTLCLERGADVNAANENGQTALHLAVDQSDEAIGFLAAHGAALDARDGRGRTPLDLAVGDSAAGRGTARPRAAGARETTADLLRRLSAASSETRSAK